MESIDIEEFLKELEDAVWKKNISDEQKATLVYDTLVSSIVQAYNKYIFNLCEESLKDETDEPKLLQDEYEASFQTAQQLYEDELKKIYKNLRAIWADKLADFSAKHLDSI